jgi:hypothetical protein
VRSWNETPPVDETVIDGTIDVLIERCLAALRRSADLLELIKRHEQPEQPDRRAGWERARSITDSLIAAVEGEQQYRSLEPDGEES